MFEDRDYQRCGFIKIVNFQTHEVIYTYHPLHNTSNDNDD
jgi:hypothetical protein